MHLKSLLMQPVDSVCLFPFYSKHMKHHYYQRCPSLHCVSSCLLHPQPTPTTDAGQALTLLSAADPGQSSESWQQQTESNQSSQTLFSRATIRFVVFFSPDLVLSNLPAQTTPCYKFIKNLPTLHPFISVSRVCRKPEPHFQYTASHTRATNSQRPRHGWIALYHWLSFLRIHIFPQLFWYDCALSRLCLGRIMLRKHLHEGMKTREHSHREHEKCWLNKGGRRKGWCVQCSQKKLKVGHLAASRCLATKRWVIQPEVEAKVRNTSSNHVCFYCVLFTHI